MADEERNAPYATTPRSILADSAILSKEDQNVLLRLYIGCDRRGRFPADERPLRVRLCIAEGPALQPSLLRMQDERFVTLYEVSGRIYGELADYDRHLTKQMRSRRGGAEFPGPEEGTGWPGPDSGPRSGPDSGPRSRPDSGAKSRATPELLQTEATSSSRPGSGPDSRVAHDLTPELGHECETTLSRNTPESQNSGPDSGPDSDNTSLPTCLPTNQPSASRARDGASPQEGAHAPGDKSANDTLDESRTEPAKKPQPPPGAIPIPVEPNKAPPGMAVAHYDTQCFDNFSRSMGMDRDGNPVQARGSRPHSVRAPRMTPEEERAEFERMQRVIRERRIAEGLDPDTGRPPGEVLA